MAASTIFLAHHIGATFGNNLYWMDCPSPICIGPNNCTDCIFDIETAVAHEYGHLLGLADRTDPSLTLAGLPRGKRRDK